MSYIREAFEKVCSEAKQAEGHFVVLVEEIPYYGGPEEGGWWGRDTDIIAYQWYPTEEQASAAAEEVKKFAKELEANAQREYGEQCLREMEWLDARGLDADYLPEPDGPSEYHVIVSDTLPEPYRGSRHYE